MWALALCPLAHVAASPTNTSTTQGRALALKFAATYPTVFILARSAKSYDPIVAEVNASGGTAIGIPTDVRDATSTREAFAAIAEVMGTKLLAAAIYNVYNHCVSKPFLD